MKINLVGAFVRNSPFGTEIAFAKGLDTLGHLIATFDPSAGQNSPDVDADVTIIFKSVEGLDLKVLSACKGPKVVYQPDDSRFPHIRLLMEEMRRWCDHALTFDDAGTSTALDMGFRTARRLLVTADDELYRPLDIARDLDFSFVGSMTGGPHHASRSRMVRLLAHNGFRVGIASDLYDIGQIVEIYNRSKVVLNHATDVGQQFGHGYGYQCRHFEVGFTRTCLMSNVVDDTMQIPGFVRFDDERRLLDTAQMLMENPELRKKLADEFYDELKARHRPEHRAAELVSFLEDICV